MHKLTMVFLACCLCSVLCRHLRPQPRSGQVAVCPPVPCGPDNEHTARHRWVSKRNIMEVWDDRVIGLRRLEEGSQASAAA
jgi:hypothetical protein